MQPSQPLTGLAKRLVNDGVFSAEVASDAVKQARDNNQSFIGYITQQGLVSGYRAAAAAAEEFGIPLLDIDAYDLNSLPQGLIKDSLISKHSALPLKRRDNKLFVAISDPTNIQALDEFKFQCGLSTEAVIVEQDKLLRTIDAFLDTQDKSLEGLEDSDLDNLELEDTEASQDEDEGNPGTDDAPIVRFVNKVLLDSIKNGASDIHFEPYERSYRIRSRIDGILQEIAKPPSNLASRLSARIKVMSKMDISERRLPQDGRIKMKISKNKAIDFRVNTLPTLWGEKIVLRILDPGSAKMGVEALGFEPEQKALYLKTLEQPQGMILVTGPTGSGKTVSLYTGLNILNTEERNISTAEDPVEINLEGINQVHVNPKIGLTFAEALRAFLRQDPDVVMVGEIRDLETAEIAIKAAQTGHMVLSTLHTNSAPETLTRLRNMGVPAFNIATSVSLIIAQRLARRLCQSCRKPLSLPEATLMEEGFSKENLKGLQLYEPNTDGCSKCHKGFKGRVGIYEMLRMSGDIAEVIMNNGNSIDIKKVAETEGFKSLRQSGLKKVMDGLTSLEELNRVIKT
ncbi:type IV-A pilus assembly ATPase PilB [Neptuniibacter sp. CAU 1671]|uniref:type IV-A pilus assembly ATPase PilB n=1 Tax=Neptuniibacter sp. CAU 1671 TaxID=3032593 RepID=UPI0023DC9030|nr:type IV-A pilus assembly ATPase PilB [Neptuniibacter sp. CAU 1671]MDF2181554.1 type IV-A pilus assembly ATPase PilB [Neptuniibacter sp. CAU 1671]